MRVYDYKYIRDQYNFLCERQFSYLSVDDEKNTVCKVFEPYYINDLLDDEYDLEDMVLNGSELVESDSIIVPDAIVYSNCKFAGYLMPYFEGKCVREYSKRNFLKLDEIVDIYKKVEKIVKESDNIVFPDLLTDGNILINNNHDIKFIDFDGFQIDYFTTPVFTIYLGKMEKYDGTKYKDGDYFTKQLDIKSLVYLYIWMLFGIDMDYIDRYDGLNQKKVINMFIKDFDIQIDDLVHCITSLYDDKKENIYLGKVADVIAKEFNLKLVEENGIRVKKLIRK